MIADQRISMNHPVAPVQSARPLPPDEVLVGLAALSLNRLWRDQKLADGFGDRIEQDLWCLTRRPRIGL